MGKKLTAIGGKSLTEFVPNPSLSLVPFTDASKTISVTNTAALKVKGTGDAMTYYFNSDTTKTFPIEADIETVLMTGNSLVSTVTIVNPNAGTIYVQGM